MLWEVEEGQASGPPTFDTGRVVAWCLTVAAILSAAGVVGEVAGFAGTSIRDRVLSGEQFSLFTMGLALAAALALDVTASRLPRRARRLHAQAQAALAAIAVVDVVASVYSIQASLRERFNGPNVPGFDIRLGWTQRIGGALAALTPALVALAVIYVVVRNRDRGFQSDAPLAAGFVGPAVACLLAAAIVLVAKAGDRLFAVPGDALHDRLQYATLGLSNENIALVAFGAVVLIVLGRRRDPREETPELAVSAAGVIGLLVVIASAYAVWLVATGNSSSIGIAPFIVDPSARVGGVCAYLATGIVGVATGYSALRVRRSRLVAQSDGSGRESGPHEVVHPTAVGIVAGCLAAAAVGLAGVALISVVGNPPFSIRDLIAQASAYVLPTAGLALGSIVAMAFARERDATTNAVAMVVAAVAVASLFASGYGIWASVASQPGSQLGSASQSISLPSQSTAQRVQNALGAVAGGLIAAGVLELAWRTFASEPVADDPDCDPEGDLEVVDLVS